MAAPSVIARTITQFTAATDPIQPGFGAAPSEGEFLLIYFRLASNITVVTPASGYTVLIDGDTSDASDDRTYAYYKKAGASEAQFPSFDLSAGAKGAGVLWRVSGAEDPATQAPEASGPTTSAAANVDNPSITPAGGPKDFLYIVIGGCDGETQTFGAPANYANTQNPNSGTGGALASNCRAGSAERTIDASSSEDPGAWTVAAPNSGASAWTIAIHPSGPTTKGPPWVKNKSGLYLRNRRS